MRRFIPYLAGGMVLVLSMFPVLAQAGRIGGPMFVVNTVPGGLSVFYDIPFAQDDTAQVAIAGDGRSILHLLMYDSDGNIVVGTGSQDRKVATMHVYRSGRFRVEVRNLGINNAAFSLKTN